MKIDYIKKIGTEHLGFKVTFQCSKNDISAQYKVVKMTFLCSKIVRYRRFEKNQAVVAIFSSRKKSLNSEFNFFLILPKFKI